MSSTSYVARSVPVDKDGIPLDPSLRPVAAVRAEREAAEAAANANPAPGADRKFDPAAFHAGLPKMETAHLASMHDVMGETGGVRLETTTKPKVVYKGKALAPIVYDLDVPFEIDGVDYERFTIASPRGEKYEDFQAINAEYGGDVVIYWLVLDGVPPEIVEAIHPIDKTAIRELALPFWPRLLRRNIQAEMDEQAAKIAASSTTEAAAQE